MLNRWSEAEAVGLEGVELLVYMSRLVGADASLVLWGGGNTSIKRDEEDFRQRLTAVMRVKGSGSDLKSVTSRDFPGVRLEDVLPLKSRRAMTDEEMVAYLARTLMEPDSPRPSIETLLHAFLPDVAVLHSHADAIVALSNTEAGSDAVRRALGDRMAIVGYRRPGFLLSKEVAEAARAQAALEGIVLMNHGLVTWGAGPKEAYDRHIDAVSRAEEYAHRRHSGVNIFGPLKARAIGVAERRQAAAAVAPVLRGLLGRRQRVVLRYDDADDVLDFVNAAEAPRLSQVGPATPDHLLNTKRLPLFIGTDDPTDLSRLSERIAAELDAYSERYAAYVARQNSEGVPPLPAEPRVILVAGLGMWSAGRDERAARIAGEIYHHTIAVMAGAQAVDRYASLSEADAFAAEYWPLELYKLSLQPPERPLARQVALVTGAASGIGRGIAERFVAEGAHVIVADLDEAGASAVASALERQHGAGRCRPLHVDVSRPESVEAAFQALCLAFGGLDVLVSNAGIAPSAPLADLDPADWERSLAVNATGHFLVTRQALRLLRAQKTGGSLIYIASKNVTAPGAGFGAYSAAKAAEAQLARIAAIEGGPLGIRANIINPDAIFEGSALFSPELRQQRAQAHGIPAAELEEFYRRRNLLQTRVFVEDVAEAALFLASARSAKTTGAMLPVDGGVREAFPR